MGGDNGVACFGESKDYGSLITMGGSFFGGSRCGDLLLVGFAGGIFAAWAGRGAG